MRDYWDSSALVAACQDEEVAECFWRAKRVTRTHAFAEIFSTLTGGRLGFRVDADEAADLIENLSRNLEIKDLSPEKTLAALAEARQRGVRGGRTHDLLHAVTAVAASCDRVVTYNLSDFVDLCEELEVLVPEES